MREHRGGRSTCCRASASTARSAPPTSRAPTARRAAGGTGSRRSWRWSTVQRGRPDDRAARGVSARLRPARARAARTGTTRQHADARGGRAGRWRSRRCGRSGVAPAPWVVDYFPACSAGAAGRARCWRCWRARASCSASRWRAGKGPAYVHPDNLALAERAAARRAPRRARRCSRRSIPSSSDRARAPDAVRLRLPHRDLHAGRRSAATATSRCRSCTGARWSGAWTRRRTGARASSRSKPSIWSRTFR